MANKAIRKKLSAGQVKKAVNKFKQKLLAEGLPVKQMILFGSYAKGKPRVDSDIDVAVVLDSSQDFNRAKIDRGAWWAKEIEIKIEPHFLSENDLANRWFSLPAQIKKFGIEV